MSPREEQEGPLRPGEEEALAELLRRMSPSAGPPPDVRENVRQAVEAEWRAVVALQRPPASRTVPWGRYALAVAASGILVSVVLWLIGPAVSRPGPTLVTLDRSMGSVQVGSTNAWQAVAPGLALTAGQELATGAEGRAQLTWHNGTTLRLDENTLIAIAPDERVVVSRGAVYVDAGPNPPRDGIPRIDSAWGSTRHVGTQYEVRTAPQEMLISVREGRVEVTGIAGTVQAAAGEQLEVSSSGVVERRTIDRSDPQWKWVETVSPPFVIEQRRLSEFLAWVARETGRDLKFDSAGVQADAEHLVLRGSVAGLDPESAMAAVMATTTLGYAVDDRQITISARSGASLPR